MAYQIRYYSDRAMGHSMSESDVVGDQIGRYPAPTGHEVAYATHSNDSSRNVYLAEKLPERMTVVRQRTELASKLLEALKQEDRHHGARAKRQ